MGEETSRGLEGGSGGRQRQRVVPQGKARPDVREVGCESNSQSGPARHLHLSKRKKKRRRHPLVVRIRATTTTVVPKIAYMRTPHHKRMEQDRNRVFTVFFATRLLSRPDRKERGEGAAFALPPVIIHYLLLADGRRGKFHFLVFSRSVFFIFVFLLASSYSYRPPVCSSYLLSLSSSLCSLKRSIQNNRSGYLRKRRETDRWLKRWCVLTETSLMYFHKPSDESPSKIIKVGTPPDDVHTYICTLWRRFTHSALS